MFSKTILVLIPLGLIVDCNSATNDDVMSLEAETQDHVDLTTDVKNYLRASSVFTIYHDKKLGTSWKTLEAIYKLSRLFSDKDVLTQTLKLAMIPTYVKYYKYRTLPPLYVVTLTTPEDLRDFSLLASNFSMSLNLWLIFFYKSPEILRVCRRPDRNWLNVAFDTKILIKCENDSMLREWYSLHEGEVKVNDVAEWRRGSGLKLVGEHSMWLRRRTLEGVVLRIATVKESFATTEYEHNHGTLFGLFGSVLRELAEATNFSVALVATEDQYGKYVEEQGNWSGVIGRLVQGDIDIGVAEFGRSSHRVEVVDFTVPLLLTRGSLYFRQPDMSAIVWSAYVEVFDNRIWVANGCMICLFSLILTLKLSSFLTRRHVSSLASYNYFDIWTIYCQQGLPELPSSISLRIVIMSLAISTFVIYTSYSATLTSFLAVFTPSLPFTTEEEFLENTDYNLTVLRGSVYHDVFQRPSPHSSIALMKQRLNKDDALPYNIVEAIDQLCSERVVFCTNDLFIEKVTMRIPCPMINIDTGRLDSASFTLAKRSPYIGILNYYIEHFRAFGIIGMLKNRHLRKPPASVDATYYPVGFNGVVPLLSVFFFGTTLSMVLLLVENLHYRFGNGDDGREEQKLTYRGDDIGVR